MDEKEDDLINKGIGVKAGWTGQDEFYKILSGLRQSYLIANTNYEIERMYWSLKNELGHAKPFIIKGNIEIKKIEEHLGSAKSHIFNGLKGNIQKANRTLAMEELYNAYELLNKLESINKMWQPTGMTTEQKIRRAF